MIKTLKGHHFLLFCLLFSLLRSPSPLTAQESIPPHQLKIEADSGTFGKWAIEVWIDDQYLGKFDKWVDKDITPALKWGKNVITLRTTWKEETLPVRLIIGAKRGDRWMTAYSYLRKTKGEEVIKQAFAVPRGLPAMPVVDGQYVMKIAADSGAMGSWTITPIINDRQVGTYNCWANADVSSFIVPGRNKVMVKGQWQQDTYDVRLTIGRKSGSSWKTVVNFAHKKKGPVTRSFQFDAKGIAAAAPTTIEKNHTLKVAADSGSYGKWEIEVLINGEIVQSLTATTSIGLNEFLKPGKNTVTVRSTFTEDTSSPVVLTIGAEKGGKWVTLLNVANRKKGAYKKDYTIIAK